MSGHPEQPSRAEWLGAVVAYLAVGVVMTWPFTNYAEFGTATYGGDIRLIIWTLAWDNHAVLSGLPLFDSNLFFPAAESLRYNEHLFGVSLFTLPLAAAGASPVLAHNVIWWLALPLDGLATYAWLRRRIASGTAAFAGSLVFVASFYVMIHVHAHLHLVWLWPLPLSLLLLERWFDDPRWPAALLWGGVVLLGVLTSWYIAVMLALVNALAGVVLLLTARENRDAGGPAPSWLRRGLTLVTVTAGLGAAVLPFARHYVGLRSAPGEAAQFAATLGSYLVPPENTLIGQWWLRKGLTPAPGAIWGEQTLFAGWLALLCAAAGLFCLLTDRRLSRRAWLFPLLLVAGFLLSLGPDPALLGGPRFAPFAWLAALPGAGGMRAPARFAAVATLGLSGLAGLGVAAVAARLGRRRHAALLLAPLMLAEWFVVGFPAGRPTTEAIPGIYLTPEVRTARALVSIPDYTDSPEWFRGGDYLYYATAHWRPIVNGFGRTQPDTHANVLAQVRAFPESAGALFDLGVQYVVVHADRFPEHGRALLDAARAHPRCRLAAQRGSDYLFELTAG